MRVATKRITINRSGDSIVINLERQLDENMTRVLVTIDGFPTDGPTETHSEPREALNLTLGKLDADYRSGIESIEILRSDNEILSNDDVIEILQLSGFESVNTFLT